MYLIVIFRIRVNRIYGLTRRIFSWKSLQNYQGE
jgi:hypothetical protein